MAKNNHGFTLIELLIVFSIIAILASTVVLYSGTYIKRGRDSQRKAELQQIRSALEMYHSDIGTYPTGTGTYIHGCGSTCGSSDCSWGSAWSCGSPSLSYMQKLPSDPTSGVSYRYFSDGATYTIEACLENSNDPDPNKISPPGYGACASNTVYQLKNP